MATSSSQHLEKSTARFSKMFEYKAVILKVIDGDTVDIEVDLGFDIRTVQRVRMFGLNAPEKNTDPGKQALAWMRERLLLGSEVTVRSEKPGGGDKYGRYLATIVDKSGSVNDALIASGHALPWNGQGAKPV